MALSIGTNNSALQAAAAESSVNRNMENSMERLSTGKWTCRALVLPQVLV